MTNLYIIEIINDFMDTLMLIYFFNKVMPPKDIKYGKVYTIIMIIIYMLVPSKSMREIVPDLQIEKIIILIISCYILVLAYPVIFRKGRISEKFFLSSIYISIMLVASFVVYLIFLNLFNITLADIILDYKKNIVILIIRLSQLASIIILLNNRNFIKYVKDITLYAGGTILILNQILVFVIERGIFKDLGKIDMNAFTIMFSLSVIQVLSLYMLNILSKEMEKNFVLKMDLDRKIHDEEIIFMYKEMVGWKHDFRNHIAMIGALLEGSTKEETISYINEIDNSISKLDKNIYTDNIAINSMLISKMKVAEDKNIKISLDLRINSEIKISNVDICTLLGNLLDNSIEACDSIKGYKFIDLTIVSENGKLIIKISNDTNGYVNEVGGKFLTTKNNAIHGIGLIQIDSIVKKHKGYINRKHENNIFTTYLMIKYEY